jgi:Resolvase, N terminal domain
MKENGLKSSATCAPRLPPTWETGRIARHGNGRQSRGYAQTSGAVIVDWFYDAAVSGADPIEARPGFAELLARIADNGVRTIIVETANRSARDLMVRWWRSKGIDGRSRTVLRPRKTSSGSITTRADPGMGGIATFPW